MIADECRIVFCIKKNPWFSILLRSHHQIKNPSHRHRLWENNCPCTCCKKRLFSGRAAEKRSQLCRSLPLAFLPTRCLQAPGSTITFTCVCVQSCHFGLLLVGSSRMNLCKEIYIYRDKKLTSVHPKNVCISVRLCRLFLRLLLGENSNIFLSHARSLVSTILLLL